jgi:hypothetical protein
MSDPKKDPRVPIVPPGKPPPPPPDSPPPDDEQTQDDSDHEEPLPVAIETRRLAASSDPDMPWLRDVDIEILRTLPVRHARDEPVYGTIMLGL